MKLHIRSRLTENDRAVGFSNGTYPLEFLLLFPTGNKKRHAKLQTENEKECVW